ncbi:MAG: hypothetical protein LBQ84_05515 [Flavobacteriaceae bacterium]|jgi:hypothetical protein|nr:hypothetical protein [Flavobacteriaceae bacterium]
MKAKQIFIYFMVGIIGFSTFISCVDNDDYSVPPVPPTGFFKETFDNVTKANGDPIVSSPWPKIAAVINFDNANVTYSDIYAASDVRRVAAINDGSLFVWLPANKDAVLTLENIPIEERKNVTLRYRFNANIYNPGDVSNTNNLIVKFNDVELTVPDTELNTANNRNRYLGVAIPIPDELLTEYAKLEFISVPGNNDKGFRIDDIELIDNYTSW